MKKFRSFSAGETIRVVKLTDSPEQYPFMPNIINWVGVIKDQLCPVKEGVKGSEPGLYRVKFSKKFKEGIVPDDQLPLQYVPTEWRENDTCVLTSDEIEIFQQRFLVRSAKYVGDGMTKISLRGTEQDILCPPFQGGETLNTGGKVRTVKVTPNGIINLVVLNGDDINEGSIIYVVNNQV